MYLYNIGYSSPEESEYIQLYHKDKLSKQEFEKIVMNSAANIFDKEKTDDTNFQDIFSEVVEDLIKNFGFKQVDFEAEFSIFGWPNIIDKNDWKGQRDELLDKLSDLIKNRKK